MAVMRIEKEEFQIVRIFILRDKIFYGDEVTQRLGHLLAFYGE